MKREKRKSMLLIFLVLHVSLMFSSLSGVCSKMAANEDFLSLRWAFFYGLALFIMFAYAIVWQQVLKRLPLSVAYANKPVSLAWGMLWGVLIFRETVTWNMIVGALIIFVGICIVVSADE